MIIDFPTVFHEEFINYLSDCCSNSNFSALIKGSLVKGTAKAYSDIDVVLLANEVQNTFDRLACGYSDILLSEHFKVYSTYMVVYTNGLAVEFDIRRTVTAEELEKGYILGQPIRCTSDMKKDRISLLSDVIPYRDDSYSILMLLQICLSKLLCNKVELAVDIFNDRVQTIDDSFVYHGDYLNFKHYLKYIYATQHISEQLRNHFDSMFLQLEAL